MYLQERKRVPACRGTLGYGYVLQAHPVNLRNVLFGQPHEAT